MLFRVLAIAGLSITILALALWVVVVGPGLPATWNDELYLHDAVNRGNARVCQLIPFWVIGHGGWGEEQGKAVYWLRSKCFFEVAVSTRDPQPCQQVISVSTLFDDGSKINRGQCLAEAKDPARRYTYEAVPSTVSWDIFEKLQRFPRKARSGHVIYDDEEGTTKQKGQTITTRRSSRTIWREDKEQDTSRGDSGATIPSSTRSVRGQGKSGGAM